MSTGSAGRPYEGKAVFVSGGSSGINLGIAEAFAQAGARVAIASRSQERIDGAVAQLKTHGGEAIGFSADVRQYPAIEGALAGAHQAFGPIDVLVSGAAGNFVAPALGMSANGFRTVVDIDLMGTFNVLRAAHAFLRKPGASVISISAPQAVHPHGLQAHVCAAKAGADMLIRVLAVEWGGDGIRLNSIIPGAIAGTEGMARLAPGEAAHAAVARAVPLRRLGQKSDIAEVALFLASPGASYITGAVIPVDGGLTLIGPGRFGEAMGAS
jgi:NAD(P)-dependent dehydrogenase (short-subunit alcohol dehydrogenase family)